MRFVRHTQILLDPSAGKLVMELKTAGHQGLHKST